MTTVGELRRDLEGPVTAGALRLRLEEEQPRSVGATAGELRERVSPEPVVLEDPSVSSLGRIREAAERGLELDRPLGLSEDTLRPLRDFGLLAKNRETQSLPRTFNEVLIQSAGVAFDVVDRGVSTIIETTRVGLGEAAQSLGIVGNDTDKKKFERDIGQLIESALIVTGTGLPTPLARPKPRTKKAIQDEVERRIERAFPESDLLAKEALKDRAVVEVEQAVDAALLQQARTKIGQPTLGEVKERARFSFTDKALTETLDALAPIKLIAEREAKARGVPPDLAPYRDMRLVAGLDGVIEAVFKRGSVALDDAGDVVFRGKSFNQVFAPVADDLEDTMLYFAGRRAEELAKRGTRTPFSSDEIQALVGLGEKRPKVKQAFDDWIAFNNEILDFAQQSGVISEAQKAAFREAGQSYVPFYRLITEGPEIGPNTGNPLKRLKGGEMPLREIMDNLTHNTVMWLDLSVKNRAKQSVYRMIDELGLDDVAERVPNLPGQALLADQKIEKALADMGMKQAGDAVSVFTAPRIVGQNMDSLYRDGKRVLYEIKDPLFLKAVTAFKPRSYGTAVGIVSGFSNVLRRGVTLSPDFMARNLIRDTQAAFLQSSGNYVPMVDALRGMGSRLAKDDTYWEMMANGGGFATLYRGETANVTNLRALYEKHGLNTNRVLDSPKKLARGLEEISSAFEQASRIAEFRIARNRGMSRQDAALSSREVSTDFAMRGASDTVRVLAASIPFLNARAQGLSRIVREARNNPGKLALKATLAMTVPSIGLYALNKNDNRYLALPDWVRDQHWVFFLPDDDSPYLIPKGFEYGALFATVPERFMEALEQRHGKAFADAMGRMVFDTFSVDVPQIAAPVTDLARNRRFSGAPVVPADLVAVRPDEQFRPWTSDTMVELARAMRAETGIEISPMQAEHLVVGYLGTLGLYALSASDMMVRKATGEVSPSARIDEVPLLRSFTRATPLRGTQFERDFYDLLGEARMISATVSKMVEQGRDPNLSDKEKTLFALRKPLDQISRTASGVSRAMRLIQEDDRLSAEEKRRRLDRLQEQRNALFFQFQSQLPKDMLRQRGSTIPSP